MCLAYGSDKRLRWRSLPAGPGNYHEACFLLGCNDPAIACYPSFLPLLTCSHACPVFSLPTPRFPDSDAFESEYQLQTMDGVSSLHQTLRPHLLRRVIKEVSRGDMSVHVECLVPSCTTAIAGGRIVNLAVLCTHVMYMPLCWCRLRRVFLPRMSASCALR
jgi:hypothetical protein